MKTTALFLNRRQYDHLATHCANWMELRWSEYTRNWNLGGVTVRGTEAAIENLRHQLPR